MRIVTRGDFDGLASSVLLTEVEQIREFRFVHPKDAQDGGVLVEPDDIVVNLPYIPGCGLWFDHHTSEQSRLRDMTGIPGRFEMAPSCARVIYNHYAPQHREKLDRFAGLLEAADRLDSANLTKEDVLTPCGWILLGLTIDPRSGLGPDFQKYFRWLAEYIKEVPMEKVLQHPEVKKRTDRLLREQEDFRALISKHSRLEAPVVITDFRGFKDKPAGNRFLVYAMFPEAKVEVRLFDGLKGTVVAALGHSIFNRTCRVNVGAFLTRFGGGGHVGAGTAQLKAPYAEQSIKEIVEYLKKNS